MTKTVLVGAGAMGEAILAGLLKSGRPAESLVVVEKRAERAAELVAAHGVDVTGDLTAVADADQVLLAVKPQDLFTVLDALAPSLSAGQTLISIAAGVTIASIEAKVPAGVAVVRVMPNTPALVAEGISALSGGSAATAEHIAAAEELMSACGAVVVVPEKQMDAVTAVSGSGPAYVFYVIEAMVEAGVHLGLPRTTAHQLAVQTVLGSAVMARDTGTHPTVLREQVTSPGGTTAAALRQLDERGVRAAFLAALEACADRSAELAGS